MTLEERRTGVRLRAHLPLRYTVLPSGTARDAVTRDVGRGGVGFFVTHALPVGTTLQLAVTLPDRDEPVHALADVVWSHAYTVIEKTDRRSAVELGVRFTEVAPRDAARLETYISATLMPSKASGSAFLEGVPIG